MQQPDMVKTISMAQVTDKLQTRTRKMTAAGSLAQTTKEKPSMTSCGPPRQTYPLTNTFVL